MVMQCEHFQRKPKQIKVQPHKNTIWLAMVPRVNGEIFVWIGLCVGYHPYKLGVLV